MTTARRRNAVQHGIAAVIFGLLAASGAAAATQRLFGLAVPSLLTGVAGAAGAVVLAVILWRGRNLSAQRPVRLAMAGTAVPVLASGWVLAPGGTDRGFVIAVAGVLAGALALFAMLSGERVRSAA